MLRLVSFLAGRFLKPGVFGFCIAYFSFLLVGLPEQISLSVPFNGPTSTPLHIPFFIFVVAAAVYSLLFLLLYLLSRIVAALFSHVSSTIPHIVAGIIVFLILGQPALHILIDGTVSELQNILLYILAPGVAIAILILLVLVYFYPEFKTINSALILISVSGSRLMLHPLYLTLSEHTVANLLIFEILLVLMSFALFAALQIRYRQSLSPDYDFFPVPELLVLSILALLILALTIHSLLIFVGFDLPERLRAPLTIGLPLLGVFIVLLIQWLGTAWELNRSLQPSVHGGIDTFARSFLFLLAISLTLFGFFRLAANPLKPQWTLAMKNRGVWSKEILLLTGILVDDDGDGNSLWPGGDPDDSDPCVRIDRRGICPLTDKRRTIKIALRKTDRRRANLRPFASGSLPRRSSMLITLTGLPDNEDSGSGSSESSATILPTRRAHILLASDEISRALRALFQDLDGFEEAAGITRTSLFTRLSAEGFRTICGGWDAGRGYLSPYNPARLDRGCQIYLSRLSSAGAATQPEKALQNLHHKYREYHEKKTFIWFHYDFSGTPDRVSATLRKRGNPIEVDRLIRRAIRDFSPKENLVVITFRGKNPIMARFSKYDLPAGRRKATEKNVSTVYRTPSFVFNRDIVGIQRHYHQPGCTGIMLREAPRITYTYRNGRLEKFNGITGARWSERIPGSAPGGEGTDPQDIGHRWSDGIESTSISRSGVTDDSQKTVRLERSASD